MTAARTFLQIVALSACFAGQAHIIGDLEVHGIRRALKAISGQAIQTTVLNFDQATPVTDRAA